jgi:3-oxoacyl-[acyl-carrier protein] reductase
VPPERLEKLIEAIPVKQLGNAAFIGKLIVQLASEDAYFTTGATWDVNGGIFMR